MIARSYPTLMVVFDPAAVEPRCQLDNAPLRALMQQSVGDVMAPEDSKFPMGTGGKRLAFGEP